MSSIKLKSPFWINKNGDGGFISETFKSKEGLKEFIHYLDENREPIMGNVISMEGEKNMVPVSCNDLQYIFYRKLTFIC